MCRLTGFGSISSDDRADYTSENKFTEYKNLADGKFGTKVSLGNFKTSLDLKETRIVTLEDDKLVKDSKISALEDDKAIKDTKIANLESDKNDKDNRVAALESDKNEKDTKMSEMESDMALLASQVSLGNVRVSLGNLATRVSSLETLGIKGISNAVSWTNLTEINLSGEKLTNGDFGDLTKTIFSGTPTIGMQVEILRESISSTHWATPSKNPYTVTNVLSNGIDVVASDGTGGRLDYNTRRGTNPNFWEAYIYGLNNWSVHSGTLDQTKLSSGIVDGTGGAVAIQQMFSSGIASGTTLVCKATRNDLGTGSVYINALRSNGTPWSSDIHIQPSDGYVEFTTTEIMYGLRLTTNYGTREVSNISLFQGEVSGGTVQAYAGGGLEKISGVNGWNAGASSSQKIEGNSDGYVQFQWSSDNVRVGLKYSDTDYDVDSPYLEIDSTTNTIGTKSVSPGDWFRIRHYASTNEIKYQRKEALYVDDTNFCTLQSCGLMPSGGHSTNHTFASDERPLVIAKVNSNGLTKGGYYRLHQVNTSNGSGRIYTLDGALVNWVPTRGTNWEIQKEAGQDYVTFYTEPTLTNGNDLYVDVSFWTVGARINDVTIVT